LTSDPAVLLLAAAKTLPQHLYEVGVALAFGVAAALGVISLFHQPRLAREAADAEASLEQASVSNELFEGWLGQVVMWPLLVLAHRLHAPGLKRKVRVNLVAAAWQYNYTSAQYLAICFGTGILGAIVGPFLQALLFEHPGMLGLVIGSAAGWYAPLYHLRAKAKSRLRKIARRMPYALDLISLSMGAGATFVEAVDTVTRDDPTDPFNEELSTMTAEMELGKTRREALTNLAGRIPMETLRSIIGAIVSAEALGTPVADVLKVEANLLRMQRWHRAEKLAGAAAVKLLVPSMLILVGVVIIMLSPFVVQYLRGELM